MTHTIRGTGIFTCICLLFNGFHVGRHTSPMDASGVRNLIDLRDLPWNQSNQSLKPTKGLLGKVGTLNGGWFRQPFKDQKKNEHLLIADFFWGAEKHLIFMLVNMTNFIRSCLEFARLLQKVTTSQWNCNDLSSASRQKSKYQCDSFHLPSVTGVCHNHLKQA